MNKVPIIRKNSYRDYLGTSTLGGFLLALIFGLVAFLNNQSIVALYIGLIIWLLTIFIYMGIGFPSEEYFKRKKRIVNLQSEKYKFLYDIGFQLHENLFFEGFYSGYYFRTFPLRKWAPKNFETEYTQYETYYSFDATKINEQELNEKYSKEDVFFTNRVVSFIPKNWNCIDFEKDMNRLVRVLNQENLVPCSKNEWNNEVGLRLKREKELELESRTIHLIKIGKVIDIKIIKAEKLKS